MWVGYFARLLCSSHPELFSIESTNADIYHTKQTLSLRNQFDMKRRRFLYVCMYVHKSSQITTVVLIRPA